VITVTKGGNLRSLFPQRLMRVAKKGPFWSTSRGVTVCKQCGDDIDDGDKILIHPDEKGVYCSKKGCGYDVMFSDKT
jgi:hypothetical protein